MDALILNIVKWNCGEEAPSTDGCYVVILFKGGHTTEMRIWAESLAVALENGRTLMRANGSDEFMLRWDGSDI